MLYALNAGNRLVPATPGARGTCRGCGGVLTAKCGRILAHHWAHRCGDCDSWAEPDHRWHLDWQSYSPPERTEVTLGAHRADIITPDGRVVEVQHSSISVDEIRERERYYGAMAWIFDARKLYSAGRLLLYPRSEWVGFRWKHPHKSIAACTAPAFLDLDGERLFKIGRMRLDTPCRGWGTLSSADDFRAWLGRPTVTARPDNGVCVDMRSPRPVQ